MTLFSILKDYKWVNVVALWAKVTQLNGTSSFPVTWVQFWNQSDKKRVQFWNPFSQKIVHVWNLLRKKKMYTSNKKMVHFLFLTHSAKKQYNNGNPLKNIREKVYFKPIWNYWNDYLYLVFVAWVFKRIMWFVEIIYMDNFINHHTVD